VESIQGFKKQIAIKRILPQLTRNKKFVAMFLDEAKVSLFLNHANIVQVFDIGRSSETFFIVMEFVDGMNLRTLTDSLKRQNRRMALAQGLFIMMEVTKGLGYAHDFAHPETGEPMGIVHRDISPPNLLLSAVGEVKLVDFGLAKAASQLEHTEPGVVKGKFSYLSPESACGKDVDHRSDIFACGIILFELLTGRRLFFGDSDFQTVELVRQANIPSMPALNPKISPELERIVLKALARNPDQRYQHVYELQDAMAQYLFSRGLKVTNRDVARLVKESLTEHRQTQPHTVLADNVIDGLIQEEVLKFTSLDNLGAEPQGSKPLSPDEIGPAEAPLDPRDFIDPRQWTAELDEVDDSQAAMLTFPAPRDPDGMELATLEDTGEDEPVAEEQPKSKVVKRKKVSGFWKALIVLMVLLILAASTFVVLYTLGMVKLGPQSSNNDFVLPGTSTSTTE